MNVTLTRVTQNPVQAIEEAASNCYDSEPTANGRIMKSCHKSGHWSVLEFADFTFHVKGVSRALLAQLTRHRVASFAVRSQRYVKEDNFEYVTPHSIEKDSSAQMVYEGAMNQLRIAYETLIELDIPAEDARFVLPNACETILEVKMNGRELIHFMNFRLCTRAQWEIREMALQMKKCVKEHDEECAQFAKFLVPKCQIYAPYNFCTEQHGSCGAAPKLKDVFKGYWASLAENGESNE